MRIQSVKLNRQTMHLPRKFLPLVWFILQRPLFFTRKNGRIGTASDSLMSTLRGANVHYQPLLSTVNEKTKIKKYDHNSLSDMTKQTILSSH